MEPKSPNGAPQVAQGAQLTAIDRWFEITARGSNRSREVRGGIVTFFTMAYIVVPQVIKNVLPALANEFISLLKETSVAGYVTVADLTYAGNRIRGVTFSPFMPLIAVALIYLVLVMFFTKLVSLLERRLRNSDH